MRDPRIVAHKSSATSQAAGQLRERQALRQPCARGWQRGGQALKPLPLCLSANQKQIKVRRVSQVPQQPGPARLRPVLTLAPAARMKGQSLTPCGARVGHRQPGRQEQPWDWVGIKYRQSLERLEIHLRSMQPGSLIGAVGSLDKLCAGAKPNVGPEDPVRVVQVGHHQIELREVIREVRRQFATASEEPGQGSSLDGLNPVDQAPGERQLGNMWVAENLEVSLRKLPAQGGDGRQREDEVADCPATNDQNLALGRVHQSDARKPAPEPM